MLKLEKAGLGMSAVPSPTVSGVYDTSKIIYLSNASSTTDYVRYILMGAEY